VVHFHFLTGFHFCYMMQMLEKVAVVLKKI